MPDQVRDAIRRRLVREGDMLYADWTQPGRGKILERNAQRQARDFKRNGFMQPMADIPDLDRELLKKRYPDAFRGDKRAFEKFLNSSEGRPYRTTPRGRSRAFSRGGI